MVLRPRIRGFGGAVRKPYTPTQVLCEEIPNLLFRMEFFQLAQLLLPLCKYFPLFTSWSIR